MKLTILCDDTAASDRYLTEHGVSVLVERPNGHRWLLDTGTTDIFRYLFFYLFVYFYCL